jgi:outer membrane protein OmpA-like peptidoglycan-associated protein/ABC-type taurine transport system substrate-binding protein
MNMAQDNGMGKARMVIVAVVWLVILAIGVMGYRWIFVPRKAAQQAEEEAKAKQKQLDDTSSEAHYKIKFKMGIDSFSGYAVLRTDEFRNELSSRGIKCDLVDDQADYPKRLASLKSGETQMAVFTLDALIKSSAELGDIPAVVVSLIDETKGADALVAYRSIPNVDALNDPEMRIVMTGDSPSETLTRVLMANFNLDRLKASQFVKVNGAKAVYEEYRKSRPGEKKAFVLWEPYVSKMLDNPDYKVLIDSSRFRGYVVDVLVVSRDFLIKNEDVVRQTVESYFRANFTLTNREELVFNDSKLTGEPISQASAKRVADGIRWKNTQENYAHFGLTQGTGYQHIEDMIVNLNGVLIKTGAMERDPTGGQPNRLYYDKTIRGLFDKNFHPGVQPEEVRQDKALVALNEKQWKELIPVGTLQVPRLVFARGGATLTTASEQTLADLVNTMKSWPQYYLIVRGHCSKEGDIEANKALAAQRAQSAVDWLVGHGIDRNRVKADVSEPNGSMTVAFIVGQLPY